MIDITYIKGRDVPSTSPESYVLPQPTLLQVDLES